MAKIKINFSGVDSANQVLKRAIREISQAEDELYALKNNVDPAIQACYQIHDRLSNVYASTENAREKANRLLKVVENGAQKYREIELAIHRIVPSYLGLAGMGLNGVGNALSQENFQNMINKKNFLYTLDGVDKGIGFIKDITELYSLFGGKTEYMKFIHDYADYVSDTDLMKTIGFANDVDDLLLALENRDPEAFKEATDSFLKEGVKIASGAKGIRGGFLINLTFNVIENCVEGIQNEINSPDMSTIVSSIWGVTGGAALETLSEKIAPIRQFIYGKLGVDISEEEVEKMLDDLGNAIGTGVSHAIDGAANVGKAIVNGVENTIKGGINAIGNFASSLFRW